VVPLVLFVIVDSIKESKIENDKNRCYETNIKIHRISIKSYQNIVAERARERKGGLRIEM
jgi:hypothetical protein